MTDIDEELGKEEILAKLIGLDVGTSNVRMYVKGNGIVLRSPSVVAVRYPDEIISVGTAAKNMLGRTPQNISVVCPVSCGVISDLEIAGAMLEENFKQTKVKTIMSRPTVLASVPVNCTSVECQALENAIFEAGAKSVGLIKAPIASALGAGLNVMRPKGFMLVEIGAGMSQVAVISSGEIVRSRSIKIAGIHLNSAIISYIKRKYDIDIGDDTAEIIKVRLGCAMPGMKTQTMKITGRSNTYKRNIEVEVTSADIYEAMKNPLAAICRMIKATLSELSGHEITNDIYDTGVVLVGGGAGIVGMPHLIREATSLKIGVAKQYMDCCCRGIGRIIENPDILGSRISYSGR